ncbi:hypothetical protein C7I36_09500 [Zobellella taiwanensis]|uniref:Uncharacterized protein n=1 Tax=Zobellella taiwanensis TaxID=347535 RepID=A0A2P7QX11_9GAMM|nr:hypothetical protein [Zobellella taiwanensis]PSJ42507.1 hypothetical protein C7I36_09500 [Zobellella taiwanensis]
MEPRAALADRRFIGTAVLGNFVLLPLMLWAGLPLLPDDPALQLGSLLAVVAIVFQSLIELQGMVIFLWWIPNRLFPASLLDDNSIFN